MHHARDAPQPKYVDTDEMGPLSKKIRRSNILVKPMKLDDHNSSKEKMSFNVKQPSGTFLVNVDPFVPNDIAKLSIQPKLISQSSSPSITPNRKRRYRNSQELCAVYPPVSCSASNASEPIRKKSDLSCVVCSAVAHGYNFDAISCESCKAFFRRNALCNMDRLKCRRDQNCEITLETRRRCKSCRLKKCFAVGMRKEWILTEDEKVNKKRRIEENRRMRLVSLGDDHPANDSLTKNDLDLQNVLLNKNEHPSLKSTFAAQSSDMIANVVLAYNDSIKTDVVGCGWSYPLARKISALCQIISIRNATALRLISFYKRLHEFDTLSQADKINLIKNNLQCMFVFQAALNYDPVHDVYHAKNSNDKPLYGVDILEAYGNDLYERLRKIMRALNSIVQIDKRLVQVAMVMFLFSSNLAMLTDGVESSINSRQQVFHYQNIYAEQLWLLIEKNYGCIQAAKIFSTLISKCLLIQELLRDLQHDIYEKIDPCRVPPILRSIMQSA